MGLGMMTQAQAVVGQCYSVDGTKKYDFPFDRDYNSDEAADTKGQIFNDVTTGQTWDGGEYYDVICDCGDSAMPDYSATMYESFITAEPVGGFHGTGKDGRAYYKFSPIFAAAAEVYVGGVTDTYFAIPFTDKGNGFSGRAQKCKGLKENGVWKGTEYESGSKGRLHLLFLESVIGTTTIAPTELVKIYINSVHGTGQGIPTAIVRMSGKITVPAKCELKNTNVTVSFGDILSGDFKTAGQMPNGFNRVHEETVKVQCSNLQTTATVSLKFEGGLNTHDQTALKTMSGNVENEDIAIRIIEKGTNQVISPGSLLPVTMNGLGQVHSDNETKLLFYPISATGKPPQLGEFNATATITVKHE
jgi:type 1 fimbria pilin